MPVLILYRKKTQTLKLMIVMSVIERWINTSDNFLSLVAFLFKSMWQSQILTHTRQIIAVYIFHQSRAALSTHKFYEILHFHIKHFDVCMHLICLTSYISFRLTFQDIIIIIIAIVAN